MKGRTRTKNPSSVTCIRKRDAGKKKDNKQGQKRVYGNKWGGVRRLSGKIFTANIGNILAVGGKRERAKRSAKSKQQKEGKHVKAARTSRQAKRTTHVKAGKSLPCC